MMAAILAGKRIEMLSFFLKTNNLDIVDERAVTGCQSVIYLERLNMLCNRINRENVCAVELVKGCNFKQNISQILVAGANVKNRRFNACSCSR